MASFGILISNLSIFTIIFTSYIKATGAGHIEPVCSKFLYDVNLFKEIMRIEFSVEIRQKELEKNVSNVMDMLTDIKKNASELTDRFSEQQETIENLERQAEILSETMANKSSVIENMKNINSTAEAVVNIKKSLEEVKTVTDRVNTKCLDGLSEMSEKVSTLEHLIKGLEQAKAEKQTVAFNVMKAVSYSGQETIKFSNIILNEGNAYNKDTGLFTAPIDGIYQFNAHICGKKNVSEIEYYIKVDTTDIVTGEFTLPSTATDAKCTSFGAVAFVRKGQHVKVGGMPYSWLDRVGSNDLSSFSGVLIRTV